MTWTGLPLMLVLGGVSSWALTSMLRRHAIAKGLLDHPNARSSHEVPTPRGGGVAIVVSYLALVAVMAAAKCLDLRLAAALLGAGGLVAVLGFIDDRRSLSARWRFGGHLVAAGWVLYWLGALPPAPIFGRVVDLGIGAALVSALFLVWSINQFNFMDGIDGLASLEAILVGIGGAVAWWLVQPSGDWATALTFAACVAGFLAWNFPPARIFMGDAGSGFLGCVVATLALASSRDTPHLFWSWLILVGVFMVDATVTLVRRVAAGERFNEAHRSHAYQYASRVHRSHKRVTLACAAINLLWLTPLAVLTALKRIDGAFALCIAYAPLMLLAVRYKAGRRADQER